MAEQRTRDDAKEPEDEPSAPPARRSKLWIMLVAANAAAIGAGAFFVWKRGAAATPARASASAELSAPGPILKLDPFIANLNEPDANRYLKCTIALELAASAGQAAAEAQLTRLRDAILMYLTSLSIADTQGAEGKEEIRKGLAERVGKVLGPGKLSALYFTEFVVQ